MPAQGVTKVKMGPEEAARKSAPQKAGSPGRRKTGALPRHRAYTSWEDENKENIDPRDGKDGDDGPTKRGAGATPKKKPAALKPRTTPLRLRSGSPAAPPPAGSPRSVLDAGAAASAKPRPRSFDDAPEDDEQPAALPFAIFDDEARDAAAPALLVR